MKLSFNWLLELVDFKGSIADLEELLIRAGHNVESVETRGGSGWEKVVIAQILESEQHPNADRLSVCKVADGTTHPRQIVCGAKNYKVGDKVPLALPGAILPGNFKIQVGKLRGVESHGMLCSGKELALAEDAAEGVLILSQEATVGAPISSLFQSDSILDVEITPNRGDCLSLVGIAREIAAFTGTSLKWTPPPTTTKIITDSLQAKIEDAAGCPFYSLRRIQNIQVSKSPEWLCSRLEAIGLKPINNVVDITNYVMFLLGQPLHAFDAAQIRGGKGGSLTIRLAREEEEFHALNGSNYRLKTEDLIIADAEKPLALAGVIGGAESSISATTTDILLESAAFDPTRIRKTSRRIELSTDSSYRFERGIDSSLPLTASDLATQLICKFTGGKADPSVVVAGEIQPSPSATSRPPQQQRIIELRFQRVNRLLGLALSPPTIQEILERIGLHALQSSPESSTWEIPTFRKDLTREVDLIEEVARLIGIEKIPERKLAEPAPSTKADTAADFRMYLHQRLTAQGFFEARTSTLISENAFRDFISPSHAIRLKNPMGEDQAFLRPTLIPGLLLATQRNFNHSQRTIRLYEIGKVFRHCSNSNKNTNNYQEKEQEEEILSLGIVATGASLSSSWQNTIVRPLNFYDLKGLIQTLVAEPISFVPLASSSEQENPLLALPSDSLCFQILATESAQFLGIAGQLSPAHSRDLGIPGGALLAAELLLEPLQIPFLKKKTFVEIPRYPSVQRDLAVVLPKSVPYQSILTTLQTANEPLLFSIEPFDIFTDPKGEKLPADRKSVAISLVFRSLERTLTNEEVAAAEKRLKQCLVDKLEAAFRI